MDFIENEKKVLEFWEKEKIFDKLRKKNAEGTPWSFLDGPITANNPMGVHHIWGRGYKDLFQRYNAMKGFNQRYQNGFDCQGLWVEVGVEKDLGFKNKKDIEAYGIDKFVEKCKERVMKYSKIQTEQSIRAGQWMDWDNSYYTMSDENNYAIWGFLKKCKEKGYLYKGRDSVPWCPRCGTAISQHEILTEEYKELTHKSIFVKYPVVDSPNTYFLVWTTTPWTLPGNVALAVQPDFDYVKIKDKQGDTYILLKEKVDLIEGGKIIEEIKGKKLEGIEYHGLFDDLPAVQDELWTELSSVNKSGRSLAPSKHRVILWKDITEEEGTGIVHIAPGCGAEDYKLSKELKLSVIDLSDQESNYNAGFGELSSKFVGSDEVREWIFSSLESKNRVFKIEDYTHRYPTCWRCKTELIFRVVDEWYISMEKLRKPLMESAKKITWLPSFGLDRELDWLKNMHDWLISKKRYWGLALPIYECQCGNFDVISSKDELKERAVSGWDKFEGNSPHRPWVDNVKIKCSKCGAEVSRIKDVGTPWLDAGIVPFSTMQYFSDKKEWKKWFPADFITESFPGQFKNWFYTLLVMSQVLEGKPPFKTVLGFATVVDEKGEEMHKSKGNAIWFDDGVEKIGADVMRWMYAKANTVNNMRFGYNIAGETRRKLLTLCNCFTFFEYNKKGIDYKPAKSKNILDKWILSRFNSLVKQVTENLDKFDSMRASRAIENFFIEDLSLWYIRRSRKRFDEAAPTLYYVLLNLAKLIAPMMPFLAETLYGQLKIEDAPESVHLCDWPTVDTKAIDEKLEEAMSEFRENYVAPMLAKRSELGINVRRPFSVSFKSKPKLYFIDANGTTTAFQEETNVDVQFGANIKEELRLDTELTTDRKERWYKREIIRHIQSLRKKAGLMPQDKAVVYYQTDSDDLQELISGNEKEILQATKSTELKSGSVDDGSVNKEAKIDGQVILIAIKKV